LVLIDGGMGTEIEARQVEMADHAWSAVANVEHQGLVQEIHEDFLRAGAEVIIANTFSALRPGLEAAGYGERWEEINRAAVAAALQAREAARTPAVVAGSIGVWPIVSDLMTFRSRGLSEDRVEELCREHAVLLADAGVDLIALEMVGPGGYAEPAVAGARAAGLPVWLGVSVLHLNEDGSTQPGSVADSADRAALEAIVSPFTTQQVAAVHVMHTNLAETVPALDVLRARWDGPLGAYPHMGRFVPPHWEIHDISPDSFVEAARELVEHGAQLVGGCCGIRPAHIAALRDGLPGGTRVAH